ncbi:MAG: efflux RND transporter periplasmic adaptor subunit [Gammaproteobacteria bacterium]|nr:efflux RND transporter periplasmic adaptor subunit [Gammaproteobacteria bacterium]
MKSFFRVAFMIVLPLLVVGSGIYGFIWLSSQKPEFTPSSVEPPAFLVGVETAMREPVTFEIMSQGTASPRISTTLISEVSGQITNVTSSFETGGFFSEGEELLNVDPRNYETVLARAELNLARAKTRLETETALTGKALDDWRLMQELDESKVEISDIALRKPQLEEVLAEYRAAEAELKKANDDLERTTIRAPYDGMILQKLTDVGQFVNTGFQLARIVAIDYAEVRLPIVLNDLQFVQLPQGTNSEPVPVTLSADIGGQTIKWDAQVVRTEGIIDEQSRVIHAVAQVADPYAKADNGQNVLRFGTFVHARIQGNDGGDLFVIPRHAVRNGTTMWIVMEDNTIQPREVSVVRSDEEFSYIANGINDGDVYCVTPIDRPLPGMRVRFDG